MGLRLAFVVIFQYRFFRMSDRGTVDLYRLINFLFKD
jgi:hypothetical protein